MSYSLNSLKGGYIGEYIYRGLGVTKGDTRSLDYSSYGFRVQGSWVEGSLDYQGLFLCTLWVCTLGFGSLMMALMHGIAHQYLGRRPLSTFLVPEC